MESILAQLLELFEASPADYAIFGMGLVVVIWVRNLWKQLGCMKIKFHKTDLALLELLLKNDPDAIAHHYNGDYYRKHPADRAVAIRGEIERMRAILKANDIEVE